MATHPAPPVPGEVGRTQRRARFTLAAGARRAAGGPRAAGYGNTNRDDACLLLPGFHRHANYVLLRPSVETQCGDFTLLTCTEEIHVRERVRSMARWAKRS